MRRFLVTKFTCATCFSVLEISDQPAVKGAIHCAGEPTGADMQEIVVALKPCERCMRPLDRMRQAVKALAEGLE